MSILTLLDWELFISGLALFHLLMGVGIYLGIRYVRKLK